MNEDKNTEHIVLVNLRKIMNDRGMTNVAFSDLLKIPESKWNKIINGKQQLKVNELSKIAICLGMSEVDIYTYPEKWQSSSDIENQQTDAFLQIRLSKEKKEQMLKLLLGDKYRELDW